MARLQRTVLEPQDPTKGRPRRPSGRVFAFRADPQMLEMLSAMPNASDFIRKAITRSLEEPCPICDGTGVVATGFRTQLERLGGHLVMRRCSCCSSEYPGFCPESAQLLRGPDKLRYELELKRGEYVCASCLESAPPCDTCGRPPERHAAEAFVAHFRVQRRGRALLMESPPVSKGTRVSRTPRVPGRYRAR